MLKLKVNWQKPIKSANLQYINKVKAVGIATHIVYVAKNVLYAFATLLVNLQTPLRFQAAWISWIDLTIGEKG